MGYWDYSTGSSRSQIDEMPADTSDGWKPDFDLTGLVFLLVVLLALYGVSIITS